MKDPLPVERSAEGGSADAPNVATADARRLANASLSLTLSQNRLITILAVGSRGDVQPYCALALGLQRAGHRVRIATHYNFEEFLSKQDLETAS